MTLYGRHSVAPWELKLSGCIFAASLSFAAGIAVMDTAHQWRDEAKAKEVAEMVRKCVYTPVLNQDGTIRCVATMPRMDIIVPYQGNPLKLKRREIKQAVRIEPKEKS